jgi:regulatory protein
MPRYKPPIKDEDRNVTDPERARRKTFDRAVNLLTYRPRSEAELRGRLLEKPWTNPEIVDGVIDKLREYNYINDEQYARGLASSKLRQKPIGRYRLKQDLKRKKLEDDTIEKALDAAYEENPEESLIETAIEKRLRVKGRPESFADRKKLSDYLVRLGFGYDLIRDSISDIRVESD